MSLFGSSNKPAGGGSGGSSLFGNTTNQQTNSGLSGSSLFGASQTGGSNQPAQSTGGIFGSNSTATPKPGGLFGASTAATTTTSTQPAASGGLFGAGTNSNTMSSFGLGTGGFGGGNMASNNAQASGGLGLGSTAGRPSLFGASNQQPAASAPGASVPAPAANGLGASVNGQARATGAYFDSLLARGKKEADGEAGMEDLPSLQLGLGDLRQRLKKLGPKAQDRPLDGKAHYLLAASGVDPGAAVKDLGFLGAQTGRADRAYQLPAGEVDVDTYLTNLQTKTTLSMIQDGLERSVRDFDTFLEDNVTMEWEAQRKRIYQHFGIKPREDTVGAGDRNAPAREASGGFGRSRRSRAQATPGQRTTQRGSALGRSNLQKSVIGSPSMIGAHKSNFSDVEGPADAGGSLNGVSSMDDRLLRDKQARLAEKIIDLNEARVHRVPYPVLYEMSEIESKSGDRHAHHIIDSYLAMMEIVGEDPQAETYVAGNTARERQLAKMYLDFDTKSQNASSMRKRILSGALRYLENEYFKHVETIIAKHPHEAALGGRPDVINKIKAYIRFLANRKDLVPDNVDLQQVQGECVWAIVYYLLRTGHVKEAASYVNDNQNLFRSIDRTFQAYMNSYATNPDRRLSRQMQDRINNEYNQRVRNAPENSIDPFRMACYKIVGRCELSNRSIEGLNADIKDWIWLQFNLAREGDRTAELASEMYGLNELQGSIREIGLKHFPKNASEGHQNGSFGMFFFLQILSGMYEQAVAYLYSFSYVDAVHFAIALEYYGLLRAADALTTGNELLSHNTRGLPQINFSRMVGYYTRDFRAADVAAAVDYICLICLNMDLEGEAGRQQALLCHEALRELILETREFSKLIGDINPEGHRIKGIIEERGHIIGLSQAQDFVKTVTLQAANFADENGRTTDAVLLYHLAGDYDSVISIINRALSEAVATELGQEAIKLVPVKPRVEGQEAAAQPGSSLSLAAIDDPIELAKTMVTMYSGNLALYPIKEDTKATCRILLGMSDIKNMVRDGQWPQAIDGIKSLEILPLAAKGDPSIIRSYVSVFSSLSQPVVANVPNLLLWTIICCTRQRERLASNQYMSGNESTSRMMAEELKQISLDLTTYTSQLRYRFPPHLHEALARAAAT